jgi:DNA anti-recombination protein RmuC
MVVNERDRLKLAHRLQGLIGEEATILMEHLPYGGIAGIVSQDDLVIFQVAMHTDMTEMRTELRSEMTEMRTELRSEMAELRTELRSEMTELRTELRSDMTELLTELRSEMAELRSDLRLEMAELRAEIYKALNSQTLKIITVMTALNGLMFAGLKWG